MNETKTETLAQVGCEEVFAPDIAIELREAPPPTYPARPLNGGPLDKAFAVSGDWWYEPKFNGWRALVHAPSGRMFNRHLKQLSITDSFKKALDVIRNCWEATDELPDWFDVEALERRHKIGRGTLIVLDLVQPQGTYLDREFLLHRWFIPMNDPGKCPPCGDNEVRCCLGTRDGMKLWEILKRENERLGQTFYEGVVAKRADSLYPFQLRNADKAFPWWMKHRWEF